MKTIENQFFQKLALLFLLFSALISGAYAQFEPALNFDGSSAADYDYIEVPDDNSLDFTTGFTFEAWIRFDDASNPNDADRNFSGLFYKSTFGGSYGLAFNRVVNTLRFYHLGFGTQITDYLWTPTAGTWYHLAVTFDGTKTAIIIDGTEVASQTAAATSLIANNEPLFIGASPNTSSSWPFEGSMEEIRMWNVAKTASELNAAKDAELKGDESGLVLYYHFNEGSIGGDNTSIAFIRDRSLQGNNGTLNGFALTGANGNFVSSTDLSLATPFTDQTITFGTITNRSFGDADFPLSATGGSSGNPVSFSSSNEVVATVSGSTVTVLSAGTTDITAFQDGVGTTRHAEATQSLTIDPFSTSINLNLPATNPVFNGMSQGISPTANDVDGNPTLAILTEYSPTGAGNFSTIVPTASGTYDVRANLDSEPNYSAAEATGTLTIESKVGFDVIDTLKVQVEAGKMLVHNLDILNGGNASLAWSLALNDTLGYGYETVFAKPNFASWQLPESQDRITNNVYITRADNKSIFNARTETTSTNVSPSDTEWARSGANAATAFDPFVTMHGGSPSSLVGDTATVHLITDDQYHEIVFSSFSGGNSGGGFGYTRTPMHDYITISGTSSGNLAGQSLAGSQITFDATNLKSGLNHATVVLTTDDPMNPTVTIVTELEVLPAGEATLSATIVGDTLTTGDAATMKTLTITNTGQSELSWTLNAPTSNRPAAMSSVSITPASGTLVPGAFADLTVNFDENAAEPQGTYEWPVSIESNDPANPSQEVIIRLRHVGTPSSLISTNIIPDPFADTFVGFTSSAYIDIRNTGTDTLVVNNIASDVSAFIPEKDSLIVLAGKTERLTIQFQPATAGAFNGTLTMDLNDPMLADETVPLNGTALLPPVIDVSPVSISQSLTVNDTVSTTVTINNTGGSDLTWSAATSLQNAPAFIFGTPVNFVSNALQADNISSNATIARFGIGVTAAQDFYNQIEYPNTTDVQTTSTTLRWSPKSTLESTEADYENSFVTVKNSLGASFVGSTISLHIIAEDRYFDLEILTYDAPSGPFANFSYNRTEIIGGIGANPSTGTTGAGSSTQFDVEFYGGGLTEGTFTGTYTISSNDPLAPSLVLPINVTVSGGAGDISTTSTTAMVTDTQVNQTSDFNLEIVNDGNGPLSVSDVTVDNPAFGIGSTSFVVPAKETLVLPLTFNPTLAQAYNATLSIVSDDLANSPYDVMLTGTGIASPDFQLASTLIQDTLAVGVTNIKVMRILNNASGDLNWNVAGEIAFEKVDYADPSTEAAQDRISDFVWFTRGVERPTYNYLESTTYIADHTSILYGNGTTFSQPTYGTFLDTFNSSATGQVGNTTSLYLVQEDRYFDLAYTSWTSNGDGGGFAYTRREAVPWLELGSFSGNILGVNQTDVTATFKTNGLAAGDYEFTYDIASNDPANPVQTVTFQLHVTGKPDINVTFASDSVRFGNVNIGQTVTMPVTVSNVGDSTLSVADIVFDDPAFSIDQTTFKVEKGKNVVLNVSFAPTSVATFKAGFTITSDDPDESPVTFGVRGTGIEGPNLDLNVTTIDLQAAAGGIATADITLSNSGQQLVEWTLKSKYIRGSEMLFTRTSGSPWTLPENQDRIADNVWISRKNSGALFNAFTNNRNFIEWAENKTVLTGPLPTYDSDISNVFGGGSSMSSIPGNFMSLHLTEEGRYFDVYFNSWANGGGTSNGSGGGFSYTRTELASWLTTSLTSGNIAVGGPDQQLTISADAAGFEAGTYTVDLVIGSTGVEAEQTVVVNLTVLGAPQIAVAQNTLDFGDVIAGVASTLEIEITNNGNATLNVSDLAVDNPAFSVSNSPLAIEPGASTLVPITFNPSLAVSYASALTITSDDGTNSSLVVNLSGNGINPPTASINVTELRESLFLGISSTQTFNIENTGSTDLVWSLAADATATTFVNPNSDAVSFSVESGTITQGNTQAVVVTFNPSGNFTGTFELPLQVVSNDPANERIDIPLSLTIGGITINSAIADQLEQPGFASSQFDISSMFTDAQGDALTYTVSSSNASIVTGSELSNTVTVTETGASGTAVVSITAADGKGASETFNFNFRVNATPVVANGITNQSYENAFGSANLDLTAVFSDTDASDALNYSAMTDATGIVGVAIANGILTLTEQGPGTVNVAVTADDGSGGQVSDVFEVFVNKINQTITFNALTAVAYGDAAYDPGATATSNLTVNYSSSNTAVATASGNMVTIVGAGTTTITASQAGDAAYNAATDMQQVLTVNQAALTATADDQSKTYGAVNPTLTVSFAGFVNGDDASVLDTAPVASTTSDGASNVGMYAITASGGVDNNYAITHVDGTLTVNQASLVATADDQTINKGDALPAFSVSYIGFVNGEDAAVLDTAPTAGVTITDSSVPGTYDVSVSGGADNNYMFTYQTGTLTINEVLGLLDEDAIKVYPNPVVNYLSISDRKVSAIEIFDLGGKQVLAKPVDGKVDLTNLNGGSYVIQLRDDAGKVVYKGRIIKN